MELLSLSDNQRITLKEMELRIFREFARICDKHHLKYMLCYGSLIGAIRHQGYIPWDDDLDVCMMREDYNKLKEICKTELSGDFFFQSHDTDPEYYYLFDKIRLNGTVFRESFVSKYQIHHGVYIDIFPVDYLPDSPILQKIQYYRFHFFRTGVMAKYPMLQAREGKKKIAFSLLRIMYCFFPLDYLYRHAHKVATRYDDSVHKTATCFF